MDFTVRDLTRLFKVSEKIVYRWIRDRRLPSFKVQDQYRFDRTSLLEWARTQRLSVPTEILGDDREAGSDDASSDASLAAAIREGGIHYEVPGGSKDKALASIARLAKLPASFSSQDLTELLLAREALSSTGIGQGVAIPHVRDPIVLTVTRSSAAVCFLKDPIDFGAIDGKPVHTFFLLLSTTIREHLRLLSKIAFILHDPSLLSMLERREKEIPLLEKIQSLERAFTQ